MSLLKPLVIAISTYSVIPMPRFEWDERAMRYSICFMPVIGLIIGGAMYLWQYICGVSGIGAMLFAAVCAVIPAALSGGIHLDGFCDTVDAVSSRQSRERKLEILKDPHTGAFALIFCCIYFLICFGLYTELYKSPAAFAAACIGFALSRALTAITAVSIKNARGDGMLFAFTKHTQKNAAVASSAVCALACCAAMTAVCPVAGILSAVFSAAWYIVCRAFVKRQFGGITGDTCGFFLQISEGLILVACVIAALIGDIL